MTAPTQCLRCKSAEVASATLEGPPLMIATDDAHRSTVGARVCLACGAIMLTATDPQGLRIATRDEGQVQEYDF
jgi:hypothetical protein